MSALSIADADRAFSTWRPRRSDWTHEDEDDAGESWACARTSVDRDVREAPAVGLEAWEWAEDRLAPAPARRPAASSRGASLVRALQWTVVLFWAAIASSTALCLALTVPSVPDTAKMLALAATLSSVALLATTTFALYGAITRVARR